MKFFLISDNTDAMIGMRLAGIEAKRVTSRDEAEKAFKKALSAEDIGILLITAGVAELCPETVKKIKAGQQAAACHNFPTATETAEIVIPLPNISATPSV